MFVARVVFASLIGVGAVGVVGCGRSSDGMLGAPMPAERRAIALDRVTEPQELDRALRQDNDLALGGHSRATKTDIAIDSVDTHEALTLTGSVDSNGKDRLHLVHDTSHEDGYEAVLLEDRVHIKPRYLQMTWHRPEPGEVAQLRAPIEQATADYVARIAKGATITKVASGDNVIVTISGPLGSAKLELDGKSGALRSGTVEAKLAMERGGKPFSVTVKHEDRVLPEARPIEAPTSSIAMPRRPRPQLDKQTLLAR